MLTVWGLLPLFGRSNGHIPFRTLFTSMCVAVSHAVSSLPPFFWRCAGLSKSPPGKSGINNVSTNDRPICHSRTTGRHGGRITNRVVVVANDDERDSALAYSERGKNSMSHELNDGKIRTRAGSGCSCDDGGFFNDLDNEGGLESPSIVRVGSPAPRMGGEEEPWSVGSPAVAREEGDAAGNQPYVGAEEGNAGKGEKPSQTHPNFTNSSIDRIMSGGSVSNSNCLSPVVGSRLRDRHQRDGTLLFRNSVVGWLQFADVTCVLTVCCKP